MTVLDTIPPRPTARRALLFVGIVLVLELLAIGTVFKHAINFSCLQNWPAQACITASFTMVGLYCVIGAVLLVILLKPQPFRALVNQAGSQFWPLGLNMAGVVVAFLPVLFLTNGSGTSALAPTLICWAIGLGGILAGLALYIAPSPKWREFLGQHWSMLLPVVVTGLAAPFLAQMLRPLWSLEIISDVTFRLVASMVSGVGYDVEIYPEHKTIGIEGFYINVAPQCSGIEGIALVTLFVTLYLSLFRKDLRFPRALLLYPLGIIASSIFNVVRIAVLLIIGLEGSPELAIGGFHSHAGWLMFTLVALGIIALAQTVPALQKQAGPASSAGPAAAPLPFRQDPVVAAILPFAIFMLSALLASAFSQSPSLIYPARVIFMAGVLALFWPLYARLPWRIDPVALGAGVIVGLVWVLIPVEDTGGPAPYGALTGVALIGWFILRGLGTVVLVPVIEELFFRSYLETRLRLGSGALWSVMAAVITAGLFAALHDRWVEAFVAGLIFSWIARRRENITDAIISHAAANLVVFGVAWATGQIHII